MTESALRITGRRSSHFTRVAVMFAHELGLPFSFYNVADLTRTDASNFADNPALRVPILHVGGAPVFGTENICRRLVELAGRARDARILLAEHASAQVIRNAQEMVWHAMATQVQIRMGISLCGLPADNPYFIKALAGMTGALGWLESHLDEALGVLPPRDFSLFEVTLFCLVEHLGFRSAVSLEPFPQLRAFAASYARRESARLTPFILD